MYYEGLITGLGRLKKDCHRVSAFRHTEKHVGWRRQCCIAGLDPDFEDFRTRLRENVQLLELEDIIVMKPHGLR